MLTQKEIEEIIKQEIDWCKTNFARASNKEFADGFLAGLEQTLKLIRFAEQAMADGVEQK